MGISLSREGVASIAPIARMQGVSMRDNIGFSKVFCEASDGAQLAVARFPVVALSRLGGPGGTEDARANGAPITYRPRRWGEFAMHAFLR